ncbi:hypothetical protein NWP22_00215 [Anabaenopsis tanganyikae CS-531]|uniref:Transposase n=1 Tax=Anabaenopsis tanganyikae CS-531 TaxID=2785304 RepID=A0ABT6K8Z1_9CYAN|nr:MULTISPECIES: hypothetical protein [Anabaenopsis]MDH6104321.1 hypothetical protein [Anabaenopsis tanganyikae CS-531]
MCLIYLQTAGSKKKICAIAQALFLGWRAFVTSQTKHWVRAVDLSDRT